MNKYGDYANMFKQLSKLLKSIVRVNNHPAEEIKDEQPLYKSLEKKTR